MTDPVRSRSPSSPDDESSVRERTPAPAPVASGASASGAPPANAGPTSTSTVSGTARDRLEQKLNVARALLSSLPAGDDRARLLHIAVLRRDEALLEGVLSSLGALPGQGKPER